METTLGRSAERTDQNTAFPAVFLMGNGPILDIRVREIFGSVPYSPLRPQPQRTTILMAWLSRRAAATDRLFLLRLRENKIAYLLCTAQ